MVMDATYLYDDDEDEQLENSRPVYKTPTISAAKYLEQIVAEGPHSPPHASSNSIPLSNSNSSTRSDLPPMPVPEPQPPQPSKSHHSSGSTSRKRHGSLSRAYARLLSRGRDGILPGLFDDISPTDSHPSRGAGRSKSPESMSALLLLTTERLSQETTRANAAERQGLEMLEHVRTAVEARRTAERELMRVSEELRLYKIQYDMAQKEILRAQEVVDRTEQLRADAEDRARRDREKTRKVTEQLAVEQALEEGRRMGYREGLERGRIMGWTERSNVDRRRGRGERSEGGYDDKYRDADRSERFEEAPRSPSSSTSSGGRSHRSVPTRPPSAQQQRMPPLDVVAHAAPLPIPTLTTPLPIRVPSTQPQQPVRTTSRPKSIPNPAPTQSPESIAIQAGSTSHFGGSSINLNGNGAPSSMNHFNNGSHSRGRSLTAHDGRSMASVNLDDPTSEIHPISVHNRSPSVEHRAFTLPPDGYIPTLGADSMISLPPPHELSKPVPPRSEAGESQRGKAREREREGGGASRVRDYAYEGSTKGAPQSRKANQNPIDLGAAGGANGIYAGRTRSSSIASRGSTRISQYDIISPPRDRGVERERERNLIRERARSDASTPTPAPGTRTRARAKTGPEQMAEDWRSAHSDVYRASTPGPSSLRRAAAGKSANGMRTSGFRVVNTIERPSTTEPVNPPRARSPRVNGGPRRPREVVLPMPLSGALPSAPVSPKFDEPAKVVEPQPQSPFVPPVEQYRSSSGSNSSSSRSSSNHTRSPIGWLRNKFQRTATGTTIPNIDVEPPSQSPTTASGRTTVNPILLTPEDANRPIDLPREPETHSREGSMGIYAHPSSRGHTTGDPVAIVLPDDQLPPEFMSLSPISGFLNMNQYSGVSEQQQTQRSASHASARENYATAPIPDGITYPDPPLLRPSTAAGMSSPLQPNVHKRALSFGTFLSPAPLNRPISIFSDT